MIDWTRVKELETEIGKEDFDEVALLFIAEMDADLAALPAALGDATALRDRLHAMKGSALNLGFEAFAEICSDGEARAQAGDAFAVDVATVSAVYDASKQAFATQCSAGSLPDSDAVRSGGEDPRYQTAHPP
ncbi:Hpt domain-containing protein [Roseivivax sp. CAU 1753]